MLRSINLDRSVMLLRIALGVVFLWFGLLKVFGYDPALPIIAASFPILTTEMGYFILGLFETIIGVTLIFNLFSLITHIALIGHLLGTMSVFFIAPDLMFDPYFPILSLAGEFVFKNTVLLLSGLVILRYNQDHA